MQNYPKLSRCVSVSLTGDESGLRSKTRKLTVNFSVNADFIPIGLALTGTHEKNSDFVFGFVCCFTPQLQYLSYIIVR